MVETITHLGLLDDEDIPLDEAALTLAALDHPGVNLKPYVTRLNEMAGALLARGYSVATPRQAATSLRRVIGELNGFAGDRDTYDDPANGDLIAVMDRGCGLPVTLSILYVALARRVGWRATPLNTPGHVLVRIGEGASSVLIDPFNGGMLLPARGISALIARVTGRPVIVLPEHVAPLSNRATLVRMLANQAERARALSLFARTLELYERMTVIAPEVSGLWWARAGLEQQLGLQDAARASLSAMLETTRDGGVRARVFGMIRMLARSEP